LKLRGFLLLLFVFVAQVTAPQDARAEDWPGDIEYTFRGLKKRIQQDDGPSEIYALLSGVSQFVIEVKDDATTLHCDDGLGRSRERTLKRDEFTRLKEWLLSNKVDQLPPFEGASGHSRYEYVHLTRDGTEVRVPMTNPESVMAPAVISKGSTTAPNGRLYRTLTKRLSDLASVPMPVRYKSIENLPGFRLVHPYEKGEAAQLSFRDSKLFASIRDETPRVWHQVKENGILTKGPPEPADPLLRQWYPRYYASDTDYVEPKAGPYTGKCIWAGTRKKDDVEGLWESGLKAEPELILRGKFGPLILSPDGEWLAAGHTINAGSDDTQLEVVRIRLSKKEVIPVALPKAEMLKPIARIGAHQKIILFHQRNYDRVGLEPPESYLLDVATGNIEKVTGEFGPLADYNWIPMRLQPSSDANVFWATIDRQKPEHPGEFDTDFGRYNTHDFSFSSLLHLPGVRVQTDQSMWMKKRARYG
jgi:hypothetical protein